MTITVAGPPGILDSLRPEDLKIVIGAMTNLGSTMGPQLLLAPELQGKVSLKSTKYGPER